MKTNKILKALLQAKFPELDIDALVEIINATPNPEVATEVLCGLYEEPELPMQPANLKQFNTSSKNITFLSYDKYNERVYYTYNYQPAREQWCPNDSGLPAYDDKDKVLSDYYPQDVAKKLNIPLEEFTNTYTRFTIYGEIEKETRKGDCRLSQWLNI